MKTSLARRLGSIEGRFSSITTKRQTVDFSRLSNDELAWLEGIAERREAWPGTEADWIDHDLTIEERLELTRIVELLE